MKTYAQVSNGLLSEVIPSMAYDSEAPDWIDGDASRIGQEIPINLRYPPDFAATLVDITGTSPQPQQGWTFDGASFAAPVLYQPTPEEIKTANTTVRDALLALATVAIAPLQDAVDLDMATDADTAALKAWKTYRVLVNRVDLTQVSPAWPTAPGGA